MVNLQFNDKTQWLPLKEACRLLQVSEVTLRQWADAGHLRIYRTPGGHRRFSHDDVLSMTRQPLPTPPPESPDKLEDTALRRIRRRLNHEEVARQSWYQSVEEEGRDRMRLFGRRLLSLLLQEPTQRRVSGRRQEVLAEALMLGHEYGAEMSERGVPIKDTVEAFIFFRTLVLDSSNSRSFSQILESADRVLIGVVESYEKRLEKRPEKRPEKRLEGRMERQMESSPDRETRPGQTAGAGHAIPSTGVDDASPDDSAPDSPGAGSGGDPSTSSTSNPLNNSGG